MNNLITYLFFFMLSIPIVFSQNDSIEFSAKTNFKKGIYNSFSELKKNKPFEIKDISHDFIIPELENGSIENENTITNEQNFLY